VTSRHNHELVGKERYGYSPCPLVDKSGHFEDGNLVGGMGKKAIPSILAACVYF